MCTIKAYNDQCKGEKTDKIKCSNDIQWNDEFDNYNLLFKKASSHQLVESMVDIVGKKVSRNWEGLRQK